MRQFGSCRLTIVDEDSSVTDSLGRIRSYPLLRLAVAGDFKSTFVYYGSKLVSLVHLGFFMIRFVNSLNSGEEGFLQIAISAYILCLLMMWGIYLWTHLHETRICEYFNKLNDMDEFIFGDGIQLF